MYPNFDLWMPTLFRFILVVFAEESVRSYAKFSDKWTFLTPWAYTFVCVSGGKKCSFFVKFCSSLGFLSLHIDMEILMETSRNFRNSYTAIIRLAVTKLRKGNFRWKIVKCLFLFTTDFSKYTTKLKKTKENVLRLDKQYFSYSSEKILKSLTHNRNNLFRKCHKSKFYKELAAVDFIFCREKCLKEKCCSYLCFYGNWWN